MKKIYAILFLGLMTLNPLAQAQVPQGSFWGGVSNNPFYEYCQLNQAQMNFSTIQNGNFSLTWRESGFYRSPSSGPCENIFDATFLSKGVPNEWDVDFHYNQNLIFGTAKLEGNILTIRASYSYSTGSNLDSILTKITLSDDQKSFQYSRRVNTWSGPTLFASGSLYLR